MRTKKEILDVIEAELNRIRFNLEYCEDKRITNPEYPDVIEDAETKIFTLKWVLGEIDDFYQFPKTKRFYNLQKAMKEAQEEREEE